LGKLRTALDAMLDQETGVRGHLIAGEERFLEPYHWRKR
jgi:CHASE3 domain sensor protein